MNCCTRSYRCDCYGCTGAPAQHCDPREPREFIMWWVVVIAILVIWTKAGAVWAILAVLGILLAAHVRNLYVRKYM